MLPVRSVQGFVGPSDLRGLSSPKPVDATPRVACATAIVSPTADGPGHRGVDPPLVGPAPQLRALCANSELLTGGLREVVWRQGHHGRSKVAGRCDVVVAARYLLGQPGSLPSSGGYRTHDLLERSFQGPAGSGTWPDVFSAKNTSSILQPNV